MRKLLNSNTKLQKTPTGAPVINAGLTMAPARTAQIKLDSGGYLDVCPESTPGCRSACVLWFAGRTIMQSVRNAAIERTKAWRDDPVQFYVALAGELDRLQTKARKEGAQAYCRLNVASDLDHREFSKRHCGFDIVREFPRVTFYDYTARIKLIERYAENIDPNYHLTYSVKENTTWRNLELALNNGTGNIAIVVNTPYFAPLKRFGYLPENIVFNPIGSDIAPISVECVDGDKHDIRTPRYDGTGRAVCLRNKGTNKAKQNAIRAGFAHGYLNEYGTTDTLQSKGTLTVGIDASGVHCHPIN